MFWIGYHNFLYPKLGEFEILSLKDSGPALELTISPCHNAVEYVTKIYKDKEKIYEIISTDEVIHIKDFEAEYNDELKIEVYAKNKNGEEKKNKNEFLYLYKEATFEKEKDHLLSGTRDLSLYILGFEKAKEYTLELYYNNLLLYKEKVTEEDIIIPYDKVEGYSGRVTAQLKNQSSRIISSFNFYLNTPIVGKVDIKNPQSGFSTRWNDIKIEFAGGENANHFYANLYTNEGLERRFEVQKKDGSVTITADHLKEETEYTLELEAIYEDFREISEKASVQIKVGKKEATQAVYVSHNPTFIKSGTEVTLTTITEDAKIYYTLDGSIPTTASMVYKKPIKITEDVVLTTLATSKNRYDSVLETYTFHVGEKTPVIYLSPSNQDQNYGIQSLGYTTEMAIMNKIADVVGRELTTAGFIVHRNNPNGNIDIWLNESRRNGSDFHFAIHSNASARKTARGPEIHIDNETSLAYSIASNIYENLWEIYDGNQNYEYHRGIKYARGSLGEASDANHPCSSLIEVAFHDEYNDAFWVMNNIENIGKNIASSIISYYN